LEHGSSGRALLLILERADIGKFYLTYWLTQYNINVLWIVRENSFMNGPKLACPNLYTDIKTLKSFALDYGFYGIDWTLRTEGLPTNRLEEARLANAISGLAPLEVRYHLSFAGKELGDRDIERAGAARNNFSRALDLISRLSGRYATLHVGLGRDSMEGISWEGTVSGLREVVATGSRLGIRVCLENLVRGWTGRPDLYEKLIRMTKCWGTLDIGHAQARASAYQLENFALAHPERILNAHIYHEETLDGHIPPSQCGDLDERLRLLQGLPLCDWWVLELRDEKSLLQTLDCVRAFLQARATRAAV